MNKYKLKYKPFGSIAVLIEWPKSIEEGILKNISIFRNKIHMDMGEYVLETVPAYNSLAVFFDTAKIKYSSVVKDLREVYESKEEFASFSNLMFLMDSNLTLYKKPYTWEDYERNVVDWKPGIFREFWQCEPNVRLSKEEYEKL